MTASPTQNSTQGLQATFNSTRPKSPESQMTASQTQHSTQGRGASFNSTYQTGLGFTQNSQLKGGTANETFSNIPERPEIRPRVISPEDQQQKQGTYQLLSHDTQTSSVVHDSFYDDLSGIEDMVEYNVLDGKRHKSNDSFYDDLAGVEDIDGMTNKPKDKYEEFKKFHEAADPLEAFCKAKGINYTNCTPREYYKGEGSEAIIFLSFLYYRPGGLVIRLW